MKLYVVQSDRKKISIDLLIGDIFFDIKLNDEDLIDKYVDEFVGEVKSWKMGNPTDAGVYFGPLSRKEQLKFLQTQIDEAGAGDLGLVQHLAELKPVHDFLRYGARLLAEHLGQRHGAIGLIISKFRVLSRLDHRRQGRRVIGQALQGIQKSRAKLLQYVH